MFGKKMMKRLRRCAAAGIISMGLWTGFQAPVLAAEVPNGMDALREVVSSMPLQDARIFREYLVYCGPMATASVDFLGHCPDINTIRMEGKLTFCFVSPKGEHGDHSVPFYLDQSKEDMTLYYDLGKGWKKYQLPKEILAAVNAAITAPNKDEMMDSLRMVKKAEVLQETDTTRTMAIQLDGKKLFEEIQKYETKIKTGMLTEQQKKDKAKGIEYFETALKKSGLWYTWTVDKKTWETKTLALNLTDLMHTTAQLALDDPNGKLSPEAREILESLAYYSEAKSFTTFLDPEMKSSIEIPETVINGPAPAAENIAEAEEEEPAADEEE